LRLDSNIIMITLCTEHWGRTDSANFSSTWWKPVLFD